MAIFKGKSVTINKSAEALAEKFSDLSGLQDVMERLPEDQRAKIGDVKLTKDSIRIQTAQVGEINFTVTERSADRVVFTAAGAPVPLKLVLDFKPLTTAQTELTTSMDVDIPVFLKPMVGGAMQKAVDQFGELMSKLA